MSTDGTSGAVSTDSAVDAVLFDVDDTLVDTGAAFGAAVAAVARIYLPHVAVERYDEVLATWRRDVHGHYRSYTRGELGFDEQRMHRAEELQAAFGGAPLGESGYTDWLTVFWGAFTGAWRAHPDVPAALDRLDAAGVPYGAVSNAGAGLQADKLARAGLDRVPLLVSMDTFGVGKPDHRVFTEACRLLGTVPARTVYVGDELEVDALGARSAGLRGVWLDRPGARRGGPALEDVEVARAAGVLVVGSLSELADRLGV